MSKPVPPTYPALADALAIIDAIRVARFRDEVDLGQAQRCFEVYGYPELSPDSLARFVSNTPLRPQIPDRHVTPDTHTQHQPDNHRYGFNSQAVSNSTQSR